ncbi:MAG: signal peptide peptidase SppA [Porphyromonas sp.]|nr:signal peptide peptidase SppA [Porphyromonas sp.]
MKNFIKMVFGSCLGVILASVVVFFIFFAMLGSAISGFVDGFSKDKKVKKVSTESVLLLDIEGNVSDTYVGDPFEMFNTSTTKTATLPQILKALEVARENPKVEAVVLKLERTNLSFASAKELRDALKRVQSSGKSIYAYSDHYSFLNYYVSSVADVVIGGPEGSIGITGLTLNTVFGKGLFQKLGVEMQVFKVGTFKGAVEPFILDKMSDANRLQLQEFLDGLWNGTTAEMAESRSVEPSVFQEYADEVKFLDKTEVAQSLGLLDTLIYRIDLDKELAGMIFGDTDQKINYLRVSDMLPYYDNGSGSDKVGVIYAEGNIVVGTGEGKKDLFATQSMINEKLVKQLREAGENDDIKAVVLRVNSGGGAATTSELICQEITRLKKHKPVVISMGDYAASGGYYISSNADKIVANPYTLTGSIGIFAMIPNAKGTMDKLGLKQEVVSTSTAGDISATLPLSPAVASSIQRSVERGYDEFTQRVAEGRGMTQTAVDSIGQGRVWLGRKAQQLGLVDMMGGLDTAIQEAARLAELDEYRVTEMIETKDWLKVLFDIDTQMAVKYFTMTNEERLVYKTQRYLEQMSGIKAMPPFDITMVNDAANQTTQLVTTM